MQSRRPDTDHMQTPPDQRGALWWVKELHVAEDAVTIAARMHDHATTDTVRRLAARLLDERLDHLEDVEDHVDAIMEGMRAVAPPSVAEAARAHFVEHRTWRDLARGTGTSYAALCSQCERAMARLDTWGRPLDQTPTEPRA